MCKNSSLVQLIQVCWQLSVENIARERNGLLDAMNFSHFEQGTIITFDQEDKMIVDRKIIEVVPFWRAFGQMNDIQENWKKLLSSQILKDNMITASQ